MGAEAAAAYRAGNSQVSMTRKHCVGECEDALDTLCRPKPPEPARTGASDTKNQADRVAQR